MKRRLTHACIDKFLDDFWMVVPQSTNLHVRNKVDSRFLQTFSRGIRWIDATVYDGSTQIYLSVFHQLDRIAIAPQYYARLVDRVIRKPGI